jgi:chromosome segregation ATPase
LDLQKKSEAIENIKQMLTKQEKENIILKEETEKLSQDAKMQHKDLNDRIQTALTELKEVKIEKETLITELSTAKEKLTKVSDSLKNSKSEFEKENQKGKAAILDLVSCLYLLSYVKVITLFKMYWTGCVALVMEYLPAKLETLSSKSKYCQNINKMY